MSVLPGRYVGSVSGAAPTEGSYEPGDFVSDRSGGTWVCTVAGSPGTWTQGAGGGSPTGTAGGDLAGTYPNPTLKAGAATASLSWVDTSAFGAKADLTRGQNGAITSGSSTLTGTFTAANGDAGKLIAVIGAGTATSRSDGVMSTTAGSPAGVNANVLTSAGASFTSALIGQRITVAGAGAGGTTLTGRVWGVISSTQIRLNTNCLTNVAAATYTISADLYATITASTATTATLDTSAGTTLASNGEYWYGTDDAPSINNAFASLSGNGGQVFHRGASALGSAIRTNKSGAVLVGSGGYGFSKTLSIGETRFMPLKPGIVCFRYGNASDRVVKDAAMTSGSATLTSATAAFTIADIGATVSVLGAGALTGSSTQCKLETTITGFTNSTTVTLAATASTTVSSAYCTVTTQSNNTNGGPSLQQVHFIGLAAATGGIHLINANNGILINVTCSDFYSGFGCYADGTLGNAQYWDIQGCNFNDCFIGFKSYKSNIAIVGGTIDGNSNHVDVLPGLGTIGIDGYNSVEVTQTNIQAYETCIRCDGNSGGGSVFLSQIGFEGFVTGIDLHSDGTNGGAGGFIHAKSWSTSSVGGATATAINLRASVKNTVIVPGFFIPGNITMLAQDASVTGTVDVSGLVLTTASAGPTVVSRTTDRAPVNNSTTLVDEGVLQFTAAANSTYDVEVFLWVNAPTNGATMDFQYTLTGATTIWHGADGLSSTTGVSGVGAAGPGGTPIGNAGAGGAVSIGLATGRIPIRIKALVTQGAGSALTKLQIAQNTATANDMTIQAGSHLKYTKLF